MQGFVYIGTIDEHSIEIVREMFACANIDTDTTTASNGKVELFANRKMLAALKEKRSLTMEIPPQV